MKRFLLLITAVILLCASVLSGCSCADESPLAFNNDFYGGVGSSNLPSSLTETLDYNVKYVQEYGDIGKSDSIKDILVPEYEGTYKSILKIGDTVPQDKQKLNYKKGDGSPETVYSLKGYLTLDVKIKDTENYTKDNKVYKQTFKDQLYSEVYFYPSGHSFAPIYSKTVLKNTYLSFSSNKVEAVQNIFQYETVYGNGTYSQWKKQYKADKDENINDVKIFSTDISAKLKLLSNGYNTYEYTNKRVIDNNQLIFAIRNIGLSSGNSYTLPTVSPAYGEAKDLSIKNNNDMTPDLIGGLKVNNTLLKDPESNDLKVAAKNISFVIGGTDYVGTAQYVVLQKNTTNDNLNHESALPLKYYETLVDYNSLATIGALEYTISSVSVI